MLNEKTHRNQLPAYDSVEKKSCEIQFRITNDNQNKTYAIFDAMNRFAL